MVSTQMLKSLSRATALLAVLTLALAACRAYNPQEPDQDLKQSEERVWYGADGSSGPCEAPAAACTEFKDDKDFVDLCVEKGFQAKTCGCAVLCSGKTDYATKTGATELTGAVPKAPVVACAPDKVAEIEAAFKLRHPGGPTDRCIDNHVCNGVLGGCADGDLKLSTHLRALGRAGCEEQLVGRHCRDAFVDSLQCPENDINLLTKTWTDFRSKDSAIKRCVRKVVCSDDRSGCNAEHLQLAQSVKGAVDRDGCEYWLRQFCSLGGTAW